MTTTTKPKGIIFRDWQVRALAEGRLTQVRVPVKSDGAVANARELIDDGDGTCGPRWCTFDGVLHEQWIVRPGSIDNAPVEPPHQPGDVVFVREAWAYFEQPDTGQDFWKYLADGTLEPFPNDRDHPCMDHCVGRFGKRMAAQAMPAWAARHWLRIEAVRAQKFGEATDEDRIAEGEKARADGLVAKADALERVRDVLRCAESECTAAMAIGDALNIIDAALAEEPADE